MPETIVGPFSDEEAQASAYRRFIGKKIRVSVVGDKGGFVGILNAVRMNDQQKHPEDSSHPDLQGMRVVVENLGEDRKTVTGYSALFRNIVGVTIED